MTTIRNIEFSQIAADWESAPLGREEKPLLLLMRNGLTVEQHKENGELRVTRIETISEGKINEDRVRFASGLSPEQVEKYRIRKDDILFSHINSDPHLGKTAIALKDYEDLLHGMNLLLLRANIRLIEPQFLHFVCCYYRIKGVFVKICSRSVNQSSINQAKLKALEVPLPPLAEQRKIAGVLGLVQRAMEQQERLIALTTELKKTLLHPLFIQGLRGEPQKQTEIGPVPQSWEVVALGELIEDAPQVNMRTEAERNIQYIDVSSISREFLRIETTSSFVLKDAPGRARKKVKTGDVIFATVRPTLLRVARVAEDYDEQVCSTAFCVLRDKNRNTHGRYIYYLVQRERFVKQLAAIESGASYPAVTDRQVKEQLVPVPDEGEQIEIARTLEACDAKISMHQRKHVALTALFRTLLHQLMTAQVRVHDLDLPELEIKQ